MVILPSSTNVSGIDNLIFWNQDGVIGIGSTVEGAILNLSTLGVGTLSVFVILLFKDDILLHEEVLLALMFG